MTNDTDTLAVVARHFGLLIWPVCPDMDMFTFTMMCDPRGVPNLANPLPSWEGSKESVLRRKLCPRSALLSAPGTSLLFALLPTLLCSITFFPPIFAFLLLSHLSSVLVLLDSDHHVLQSRRIIPARQWLRSPLVHHYLTRPDTYFSDATRLTIDLGSQLPSVPNPISRSFQSATSSAQTSSSYVT